MGIALGFGIAEHPVIAQFDPGGHPPAELGLVGDLLAPVHGYPVKSILRFKCIN